MSVGFQRAVPPSCWAQIPRLLQLSTHSSCTCLFSEYREKAMHILYLPGLSQEIIQSYYNTVLLPAQKHKAVNKRHQNKSLQADI